MNTKTWASIIGVLGIIDYFCAAVLKRGTLSQGFRNLFRTDTQTGKIVWGCFWIPFAYWFWRHVLKWPTTGKESLEVLDRLLDS